MLQSSFKSPGVFVPDPTKNEPIKTDPIKTDLCVIGAGSGGLSVAAAAAMMGVPVVLIERDRMGGDCLNVGCVPSKTLIAAGKHAAAMRNAVDFGFNVVEIKPAFNRVNAHVHAVIKAIAPNDSVERFTALGATVLKGEARFINNRIIQVGDQQIIARRIIIATGSRPAIPPIQGLSEVPYLTNESLFDLTRKPGRLVVIGAGPIGMEMAQAHARLGCEVVVVEPFKILGREDPEAARVVKKALEEDGVVFRSGCKVTQVSGAGEKLKVTLETTAGEEILDCTHILVATGRMPSMEGLDLDTAGVKFMPTGITVDSKLRTTNRRVYAIGDVIGPPQFTHRANYHAGLVIRHALFRQPVKATDALIPRVTYTDPEIASVGLSEDEARKSHANMRALRWPFAENDRAQTERRTEGFVKVMVDAKGRILGVTIVGHNAGELLTPWTLAMANGLKITAMTNITFPYPTFSEASKRAAGLFLMPKLRSPWLQRVLRFMRWFG
jgi:pyruvate/2-oxoglutarate dehydrogenase complex dihydrolipoamide dehydrogenase (E3) component